jgi:hypothetical protein
VPAGVTVAVTVAGVPGHTVGLLTITVGNGFTVTVLVTAAPGQVPSVGIILYSTDPAAVPDAKSVWAMVLPLPFDAPVALVDNCVQANVAPVGVLVSAIAVTSPEHIVEVGATVAVGVGLTTIVAVAEAAQPTGANVTR